MEICSLTEPEIEPSCGCLPLTLKVTPLGAFDLTSRAAASNVSEASSIIIPAQYTLSGVVEVLVQELDGQIRKLYRQIADCDQHHLRILRYR